MNNVTLYGRNPFDLLDSIFTGDSFFNTGDRSPVVDIREDKDRYVIEAELPGLTEKDVKLELKDSVLTLSTASEKDDEKKAEDDSWIRRERRSFRFSRSFALPEDADSEKIEARFRDGLLTVELHRKPEAAPRLVPVQAA
ncbi:MAG: Hsp20/alpha crystallin family protein [Rectinemataceae bacterium]